MHDFKKLTFVLKMVNKSNSKSRKLELKMNIFLKIMVFKKGNENAYLTICFMVKN